MLLQLISLDSFGCLLHVQVDALSEPIPKPEQADQMHLQWHDYWETLTLDHQNVKVVISFFLLELDVSDNFVAKGKRGVLELSALVEQ